MVAYGFKYVFVKLLGLLSIVKLIITTEYYYWNPQEYSEEFAVPKLALPLANQMSCHAMQNEGICKTLNSNPKGSMT